jgi:hypothetical protein
MMMMSDWSAVPRTRRGKQTTTKPSNEIDSHSREKVGIRHIVKGGVQKLRCVAIIVAVAIAKLQHGRRQKFLFFHCAKKATSRTIRNQGKARNERAYDVTRKTAACDRRLIELEMV